VSSAWLSAQTVISWHVRPPGGNFDRDAAVLRVNRSMEETAEGLRLKPPKMRNGRRTISLPSSVVDVLRAHRVKPVSERLAPGLGRAVRGDLVSTMPDSAPRTAGQPIARLASRGPGAQSAAGHGSAAFTLNTYTHLFADKADAAARAMDAAMIGSTGANR
jgi:hypothetical protein